MGKGGLIREQDSWTNFYYDIWCEFLQAIYKIINTVLIKQYKIAITSAYRKEGDYKTCSLQPKWAAVLGLIKKDLW